MYVSLPISSNSVYMLDYSWNWAAHWYPLTSSFPNDPLSAFPSCSMSVYPLPYTPPLFQQRFYQTQLPTFLTVVLGYVISISVLSFQSALFFRHVPSSYLEVPSPPEGPPSPVLYIYWSLDRCLLGVVLIVVEFLAEVTCSNTTTGLIPEGLIGQVSCETSQ